MKTRGEGRVYNRGKIFWIQYCHRGQVFRESSGSPDGRIAQRLLRKRLGEIGIGAFKGPKVERTTFSELAEDIKNDYQVNGKKSGEKVKLSLSHLEKAFGLDRMIDVTTDRIKTYIVGRQKEGAANASINRELATLKRMFSLGLQAGKVALKPYIPTLRENNIRQGFFEQDDFIRLRKALPEHLRPLVTFAYFTGWRSEEIRSLQWRQVDLKAGSVRLEVGTTKNGQGRICFLPKEVLDLLKDLWENRRLDCPWVFNREGKFIGSFRKSWTTACKTAKLPGMLFHDFRRTAVRGMIRAGIAERVAMEISGHKTRSVFDRYHIVSENDLKEAAQKVERFSQSQAQAGGKVIPFKSTQPAFSVN